jgi:copper chaperone CopZ
MSCSGCSNAVSRALNKLDGKSQMEINLSRLADSQRSGINHRVYPPLPGVQNVNCDLDTQLVTVDTTLPKETVLAAIEKTGKAVSPVA